jgi:cation diffusion facilitator CzcD-associated flavoprotein CzcO
MTGDTRTWQRTYIQLTVKTDVELELQSIHGITLTGHSMQLGEQEVFTENMKRRLANKPGLIDELLPSFPPACRRLTPGPGYPEALTDDKVDLITSDIVKVDETGIITADGQHRPVDMLVCATGFDTTCTPICDQRPGRCHPFGTTGTNPGDLSLDRDRWVPELFHFPRT